MPRHHLLIVWLVVILGLIFRVLQNFVLNIKISGFGSRLTLVTSFLSTF